MAHRRPTTPAVLEQHRRSWQRRMCAYRAQLINTYNNLGKVSDFSSCSSCFVPPTHPPTPLVVFYGFPFFFFLSFESLYFVVCIFYLLFLFVILVFRSFSLGLFLSFSPISVLVTFSVFFSLFFLHFFFSLVRASLQRTRDKCRSD